MKKLRTLFVLAMLVLAMAVPALVSAAEPKEAETFTASDVLSYKGLSVRTLQDYAGLRSVYTVNRLAVNALEAAGSRVTYGAIMGIGKSGGTSYLTHDDMTITVGDSALSLDCGRASLVVVYDSEDGYGATNAFTAIGDTTATFAYTTTFYHKSQTKAMLMDTELIYRGFVIVDGTVHYVDALGKTVTNANDPSASLYEVCKAYVGDSSTAEAYSSFRHSPMLNKIVAMAFDTGFWVTYTGDEIAKISDTDLAIEVKNMRAGFYKLEMQADFQTEIADPKHYIKATVNGNGYSTRFDVAAVKGEDGYHKVLYLYLPEGDSTVSLSKAGGADLENVTGVRFTLVGEPAARQDYFVLDTTRVTPVIAVTDVMKDGTQSTKYYLANSALRYIEDPADGKETVNELLPEGSIGYIQLNVTREEQDDGTMNEELTADWNPSNNSFTGGMNGGILLRAGQELHLFVDKPVSVADDTSIANYRMMAAYYAGKNAVLSVANLTTGAAGHDGFTADTDWVKSSSASNAGLFSQVGKVSFDFSKGTNEIVLTTSEPFGVAELMFVRESYTVEFAYEDGTVFSSQKVYYGDSADIPKNYKVPTPSAEAGKEGSSYANINEVRKVTGDVTVSLVYGDYYTIQYYDYDGKTLLSTNNKFVLGSDGDAPYIADDGREFIGWALKGTNTLVNISELTGHAEVYAVGRSFLKDFSVSANDIVLSTETFTPNAAGTADATGNTVYYKVSATMVTKEADMVGKKCYTLFNGAYSLTSTFTAGNTYTLALEPTATAEGSYTYSYTVDGTSPITLKEAAMGTVYAPGIVGGGAAFFLPTGDESGATNAVHWTVNAEYSGVYEVTLVFGYGSDPHYFNIYNTSVDSIRTQARELTKNATTTVTTKVGLLTAADGYTASARVYLQAGENVLTLACQQDKNELGTVITDMDFSLVASDENGSFVRAEDANGTHSTGTRINAGATANWFADGAKQVTLSAGTYHIWYYGLANGSGHTFTYTLGSKTGTSTNILGGLGISGGGFNFGKIADGIVLEGGTYDFQVAATAGDNYLLGHGFLIEKVSDDASALPEGMYTVSFYDRAGNLLSTTTVPAGGAAVPPVVLDAGFCGWDPSVDYTNVTENLIVRAVGAETVKVYFYLDGKLVATSEARQNGMATAPDLVNYDEFLGWSPAIDGDAYQKTTSVVAGDTDTTYYAIMKAPIDYGTKITVNDLGVTGEVLTKTTTIDLTTNPDIVYYTVTESSDEVATAGSDFRQTAFWTKDAASGSYTRAYAYTEGTTYYFLVLAPVTDATGVTEAYTYSYNAASINSSYTLSGDKAGVMLSPATTGIPTPSFYFPTGNDYQLNWKVNAKASGVYRMAFTLQNASYVHYLNIINTRLTTEGYKSFTVRARSNSVNTIYTEATNKAFFLLSGADRVLEAYVYLFEGENDLSLALASTTLSAERGATGPGVTVTDISLTLDTDSMNGQFVQSDKSGTNYQWLNPTTNGSENKPYQYEITPPDADNDFRVVTLVGGKTYNLYLYGRITNIDSSTALNYSFTPTEGDAITGKLVLTTSNNPALLPFYGTSTATPGGGVLTTFTVPEGQGGEYIFRAVREDWNANIVCAGFVITEKIPTTYTATFMDGDKLIKMESVKELEFATDPYAGKMPEGFNGWVPLVDSTPMTSDVIFEESQKYTVIFVDASGNTLLETYVEGGRFAETPSVLPTKPEAIFDKWYPAADTVKANGTIIQPVFLTEGDLIYVDPVNGSDNNDGSVSTPLATIQAAVDRAAEMTATGRSITVRLLPGTYRLSTAVQLQNVSNITIQGSGDHQSIITSAIDIPVAAFTKTGNISSFTVGADHPLYNVTSRDMYAGDRLFSVAKTATSVMRYDTAKYASMNGVEIGDRILYVNKNLLAGVELGTEGEDGKQAIIGGCEFWIQTDWQVHCLHLEYVDTTPDGTSTVHKIVTDTETGEVTNNPFVDKNGNELWAVYVSFDTWYDFVANTTGIVDDAGEPDGNGSYYGSMGNSVYWLANNKAFIDEAGEFVYDQVNHVINVYIPEGEDITTVSVPTLETLISFNNITNIKLENLTLTGTTQNHVTQNGFISGQGGYVKDYVNPVVDSETGVMTGYDDYTREYLQTAAIFGMGANGLTVNDMYFLAVGGDAIHAHGKLDTIDVTNSFFYNIGGTAVRFAVYGGAWIGSSEFNRNIVIQNNKIEKTGVVFHSATGIMVSAVDTLTIKNNTILDSAYSAISVGLNWSRYGTAESDKINIKNAKIEYNYIEDFLLKTQDGGAIYVLGGNAPISGGETGRALDYDEVGNSISYNYVVVGPNTGNKENHYTVIYHDQGASHWHDKGNVLIMNPAATHTQHTYISYQSINGGAYNNWTDGLTVIGYSADYQLAINNSSQKPGTYLTTSTWNGLVPEGYEDICTKNQWRYQTPTTDVAGWWIALGNKSNQAGKTAATFIYDKTAGTYAYEHPDFDYKTEDGERIELWNKVTGVTIAKDFSDTSVSALVALANAKALAPLAGCSWDRAAFGSFSGRGDNANDCTHDYSEVDRVNNSCTAEGYIIYVCDLCGHAYMEDLPATGHSEKSDKTDPTCTEDGSIVYTCTVCGVTIRTETLPATGHDEDDGTVTTDPTCSEEGVMTYTCTVCGVETREEAIPTIDHNYTEGDDGTCTYCGKVNPETCIHTYGPVVITKAPEIGVAGEYTTTCSKCEKVETTALPARPAVASGTLTATVSDQLSATVTATKAGFYRVVVAEALRKQNYYSVYNTAAGWGSATVSMNRMNNDTDSPNNFPLYVFLLEGENTLVFTNDAIKNTSVTLTHISGEIPSAKEDVETPEEYDRLNANGTQTFTLNNATAGFYFLQHMMKIETGAIVKVVVKNADGNAVATYDALTAADVYMTAADQANGSSGSRILVEYGFLYLESGVYTVEITNVGAGYLLVGSMFLTPLTHTHTEATVTTEATCTEDGLTTKTCTECGYVISSEVSTPKLGHDEKSHEAKAPTCTEIGWDAYVTCSRCNYTTYVELEATGHDFETEDGSCANGCGQYDPDKCTHAGEITAEVATVPTAGNAGLYSEVCVRCGKVLEAVPLNARPTVSTEAVTITSITQVEDSGKKAYDIIVNAPKAGFYRLELSATFNATKQYTSVYNVQYGAGTASMNRATAETAYGIYVYLDQGENTLRMNGSVNGTLSDISNTPTADNITFTQVAAEVPTISVNASDSFAGVALGANGKAQSYSVHVEQRGFYFLHAIFAINKTATTATVELKTGETVIASKVYVGTGEYVIVPTDVADGSSGTRLLSEIGYYYLEEGDYTVTITSSGSWVRAGTIYLTLNTHIHNYVTTVVDPTCKTDGYTADMCACGDMQNKRDEVSAGGHTYGEWTVTLPTVGAAGEATRECLGGCGTVDSVELPARPAVGATAEGVISGTTITVNAPSAGFYRVIFSGAYATDSADSGYFTIYNNALGTATMSKNRVPAKGDIAEYPLYVYLDAGENTLTYSGKTPTTATFTQMIGETPDIVVSLHTDGTTDRLQADVKYKESVSYNVTVMTDGFYFLLGSVKFTSASSTLKLTATDESGNTVYTVDALTAANSYVNPADKTDGSTGVNILGQYGFTYLTAGSYTVTVDYVSGDYALINSLYLILNKSHHVHNFVTESKEATCTEAGYVNRVACSCGEVLSVEESTPALGHQFVGDITLVTEPSFTEDGSYTQHCDRCNTDVTVVLPMRVADGGTLTATVSDKEVVVTATKAGFYRVVVPDSLIGAGYVSIYNKHSDWGVTTYTRNRVTSGKDAADYPVYVFLYEGENRLYIEVGSSAIGSSSNTSPDGKTLTFTHAFAEIPAYTVLQAKNDPTTQTYSFTGVTAGFYYIQQMIRVIGDATVTVTQGEETIATITGKNASNAYPAGDSGDGSTDTALFAEYGFVYLAGGDYTVTVTTTSQSYRMGAMFLSPITHTHTEDASGSEEATCGENGRTYIVCGGCGAVLTDEVVFATGEHKYTNEVKVPTCTEDGYERDKCSVCGDIKDNIDDAAEGHDLTEHAAVTAGCETNGNVHYFACSRCNKNYGTNDLFATDVIEYVVTPATGHHYVDGACENCGTASADPDTCEHTLGGTKTLVTAPTTEAVGSYTQACTKCGTAVSVSLPVIPKVDATTLTIPAETTETTCMVNAPVAGMYKVQYASGTASGGYSYMYNDAFGDTVVTENRLKDLGIHFHYVYLNAGNNTIGVGGDNVPSLAGATLTLVDADTVDIVLGNRRNQMGAIDPYTGVTYTYNEGVVSDGGFYRIAAFASSVHADSVLTYTFTDTSTGEVVTYVTPDLKTLTDAELALAENGTKGATYTTVYVEFGMVYLPEGEYTVTVTMPNDVQYIMLGSTFLSSAE